MQEYKRILCIDYGERRIGIAITDPLCIIAQPLLVLFNDGKLEAGLQKLINDYQLKTIVVGMPFTLKGEIAVKGEEVRQFIAKYLSKFNLPIVEWDERYSTKTVHQTRIDMGVKKKARQSKEMIDAMAAAVILQSYLESVK